MQGAIVPKRLRGAQKRWLSAAVANSAFGHKRFLSIAGGKIPSKLGRDELTVKAVGLGLQHVFQSRPRC